MHTKRKNNSWVADCRDEKRHPLCARWSGHLPSSGAPATTTTTGIHSLNKSFQCDMAHPFFRHFCAVFLATLCFVGIFKLNNNNPSKTVSTPKENFSGDDFEGFEKSERLQLDGLRSFGGGKTRNESVYFLGLFEKSTKFGVRRREGESEVSAARLAVDHVNRMGVLPGYTLRLLINDTKVRDKSFQI